VYTLIVQIGLAQCSFVTHSCFHHNLAGIGIAEIVAGINPIYANFLKTVSRSVYSKSIRLASLAFAR
jgi:hypothetical protein